MSEDLKTPDTEHFYQDESAVNAESKRQNISRHLMVLNSCKNNIPLLKTFIASLESLKDLDYIHTEEQLLAAIQFYTDKLEEENKKIGQADSKFAK